MPALAAVDHARSSAPRPSWSMTDRSITAILILLTACSDPAPAADAPPSPPDSPPAPDATTDAAADAPPPPDADLVPDAHIDPACAAGQLCLNVTSIDGTQPPPGRLAVAWVKVTDPRDAEVAFDEAWAATQVTGIDLADIALPSDLFQLFNYPGCPGAHIAVGFALASTDPDGSDTISSTEVMTGFDDHTAYGLLSQDTVVWTDIGCPPGPEIPNGILAGTHVYPQNMIDAPLDGMLVPFLTCAPGAAACADLISPF
jgi:hypothetical protein